jgi:hypothetical protein
LKSRSIFLDRADKRWPKSFSSRGGKSQEEEEEEEGEEEKRDF